MILVTALTGAVAIYLSSLSPFVTLTTADIRSWSPPVTLDTDAWTRFRNPAYGYEYGAPPGWIAVADDPADVKIARSPGAAIRFGDAPVMSVETRALGERLQPENIAVQDFAGTRPALYDVGVNGREGLFAISFRNGRVRDQAVYLPMGDVLYVFRGGNVDPAVFSAFVSTIKFFTP